MYAVSLVQFVRYSIILSGRYFVCRHFFCFEIYKMYVLEQYSHELLSSYLNKLFFHTHSLQEKLCGVSFHETPLFFMQWRSFRMLFRIPPFQFKALQKCMSCSQPLLNYPFKQAFSFTHVRCREREKKKYSRGVYFYETPFHALTFLTLWFDIPFPLIHVILVATNKLNSARMTDQAVVTCQLLRKCKKPSTEICNATKWQNKTGVDTSIASWIQFITWAVRRDGTGEAGKGGLRANARVSNFGTTCASGARSDPHRDVARWAARYPILVPSPHMPAPHPLTPVTCS